MNNMMTEELDALLGTMLEMQQVRDEMGDTAWLKVEEDEDLTAVLDGHRDDWEKLLVMNIAIDMFMAGPFAEALTPKHDWLKPYMLMAKQYQVVREVKARKTKTKTKKRAKKKTED